MASRIKRILPVVAIVVAGTLVASCGGKSGGSTMSTEDFCQMITDLDKTDPFANLSDTATADETKAAFQQVEGLIDDLYAAAPAEIKPDIKTVQGIYSEMIALFEKANWDYTAIDFEAFSAIDTAKADEATTRLDTWQTTNCK